MSDVGEAAIRARAEKATPGPWDMDAPSSGRPFEKIVVRNLGGGSQRAYVAQASSPADWEFIAHAREDIPYLLGRVSSLSAQLAETDKKLVRAGRWRDAAKVILEKIMVGDQPALDVITALAVPTEVEEKKQ